MPSITIDQREVVVPEGATILDAARTIGLEIPTLCHLKGYTPSTSCLVCIVKVGGRLVPSCATVAVEGMRVESETEEVHQVRRTTLELLLSDHVGDCLAPCHFACPAHMDIPLMLRQISSENLREAIATIKQAIALPAVLGRVCPKPCEKGCRRSGADGAVAICDLKRFVADQDLASPQPYLPDRPPETGRSVAVVGAGPTGLSAAYYLRREGHQVVIYEQESQLGGRLRREFGAEALPPDVLDAEIATITAFGIETRLGMRFGRDLVLEGLLERHDAVLIACGAVGSGTVESWQLVATPRGIGVEKETYATSRRGCSPRATRFAPAGRRASVADGRRPRRLDDSSRKGRGGGTGFSSRIGKLTAEELQPRRRRRSRPRQDPLPRPPGRADARRRAGQRCLYCDCRAHTCSQAVRRDVHADPNRWNGERAGFSRTCGIDGHL